MAALAAEGLVVRDTVIFREVITPQGQILEVNVRGRVETAAAAIVTVNKWLAVSIRADRRISVRTREYDYHASVRTPRGLQDIFRYDNCHGDITTLHRHAYDSAGSARGQLSIEPNRMPPLSFVVREADFFARFLSAGEAAS